MMLLEMTLKQKINLKTFPPNPPFWTKLFDVGYPHNHIRGIKYTRDNKVSKSLDPGILPPN